MESVVFGLSNTKHLCMNAQSCIGTSSPALRQWWGESATSEYLKAWLSSLAFDTKVVHSCQNLRNSCGIPGMGFWIFRNVVPLLAGT